MSQISQNWKLPPDRVKFAGCPGWERNRKRASLQGLESLSRRSDRIPLGVACPFAEQLLEALRAVPGVLRVEMGGSLRRMRATVGDLDILAAAPDSSAVIEAFTSLPQVSRILSKGDVKASVEFQDNLRAQLWVHPPERFGTALQYATGSKDHNVRLRELAQKQGLSLSDQAFLRPDGSELLCASEEEVYDDSKASLDCARTA